MSIQKRLFLSNFAMIFVPIIIIILIMLLLNIVMNGSFSFNDKHRWQAADESTLELYNELKKTASLYPDRLSDPGYMGALINNEETNIIVRKGVTLTYLSKPKKKITSNDLPEFGNEGFNPAGIRMGTNHYAIRQHDFYYHDGAEGSIFLLDQGTSFTKWARTFFPAVFISLIFVLISTNVLLSYFMSRSILRPVNQLTTASKKVSNGDLDFTMHTKNRDELGMLIHSFDTMRAQLKESLALRDKYENNRRELIANISHDLKTPVTSIIGYVEGIQDGVANSPTKQKRYLETIHSKATYMNRLVEALALYSKLDVNKQPFHFERINIRAFIQDYLDEIESELSEKNILLTQVTNHVQANVLLDRNQFIRVLDNVIYNSVKYMDKQPGYITVALADQGEMIKLSVLDNGPGVATEKLSAIFNRFYRTDPSRGSNGSGLGLAIASQIIHAHGGTIWAENPPNEGLAVHFTIKKMEGDHYVQKDINH